MINIRVRVRHLFQKYGTRNPEQLAKELNVIIVKKPFKKTLGFFKRELGRKFIVVNSNLDEANQLLVIAHELGHALLHGTAGDSYLHEYTLFPRGRYENEANKFAAELLIDECNIDKVSLQNLSINQLSCYFRVPERLIMHKFFE